MPWMRLMKEGRTGHSPQKQERRQQPGTSQPPRGSHACGEQHAKNCSLSLSLIDYLAAAAFEIWEMTDSRRTTLKSVVDDWSDASRKFDFTWSSTGSLGDYRAIQRWFWHNLDLLPLSTPFSSSGWTDGGGQRKRRFEIRPQTTAAFVVAKKGSLFLSLFRCLHTDTDSVKRLRECLVVDAGFTQPKYPPHLLPNPKNRNVMYKGDRILLRLRDPKTKAPFYFYLGRMDGRMISVGQKGVDTYVHMTT